MRRFSCYVSAYTGDQIDQALKNAIIGIVRPTGDYSILDTDRYVLATTDSANSAITLLSIVGGQDTSITIKKINSDVYKIVITPAAGETIEGQSTYDITTQYQYATFVHDGISNWLIVAAG